MAKHRANARLSHGRCDALHSDRLRKRSSQPRGRVLVVLHLSLLSLARARRFTAKASLKLQTVNSEDHQWPNASYRC
jgi:hypothetical protein